MKAFLSSLLVLLAVNSRGALVYFDHFSPFPAGTDLVQTNYVPGPWMPPGAFARITTNNGNASGASIVASNLLGNIRLFANAPAGTQPEYDANLWSCESGLTAAVTNQVVQLRWLSWIATTKSLTATGGLAVGLSATNLNDVCCNGNSCITNLEPHMPLMIFADGGGVYVFTNEVKETAARFPLVQIGSWSSYAGQIMTNQLTLNYPARKLAFSLNGTVLTNNVTLPAFATNILTEADFYCVEQLPTSVGNKFALDSIQIVVSNSNPDVFNYIAAAKGLSYQQTAAATVALQTNPYTFHSDLEAVESNTVYYVTLHLPTGDKQHLAQDDPTDPAYWELTNTTSFADAAALNAVYSNGLYRISILGAKQGLRDPAFSVTGDGYPNTPQIANWAASQTVDATKNFTLQWNSSGGAAKDYVIVHLWSQDGVDKAFDTSSSTNFSSLNGTATSVVVPANTLQSASTYEGDLIFIKTTAQDTNTVLGAMGIAGYYKYMSFSITTTGAPSSAAICSLAPLVGTNTINSTYTATATITSNGAPVEGLVIDFAVIAGPNLGNSGTAATDAGGQAGFSYSSSVTGTDTVQATSVSTTCTVTEVWLAPNVLPVAICSNVTVAASAGCQASVTVNQVDGGSYDPDGLIVSRSLASSGPFGLGVTNVTLTVVDNRGGSNSCVAAITVVDQTLPTIACHANIVTNVPNGTTNAVVTFSDPVASDNCSLASATYLPPSGSTFNLGTNTVTGTAIDGSGNTNTCTFTVTVLELPPVPHNLAVTTFKAPKKVTLTSKKHSVTSKLSVTIQNRSPQTEVVPDLNALSNLVTIALTPLGTNNCPAPVVTFVTPKKLPPYTVAPGKTVKLAYTVVFNCATDPATTSKTVKHNDYQYLVTVHHEALDGLPDTYPADDVCPHNALGVDPYNSKIKDKGCGVKQPDASFGPVVTDIIQK